MAARTGARDGGGGVAGLTARCRMLEVDAEAARAAAAEVRGRLADVESAAAARAEEARRLDGEQAAGIEGAVRATLAPRPRSLHLTNRCTFDQKPMHI